MSEKSSYSTFLSKLNLPQPQLHRHVIISIFKKLASDTTSSDYDFRNVISQCLTSKSTTAVDQSIRELCVLFKNGVIEGSVALMELQSALDGCDSKFVGVFVKAIGFVCRLKFEKVRGDWVENDVELHPFVKVLSCREEVQAELIQQVLLFITHNRTAGMEKITKFLRPFFMFSVMGKPFSVSSMFSRDLISAVASLSCSFPSEAIYIIKLLTDCVTYFPCTNEMEFRYLFNSVECVVDFIMVVLRQLVSAETNLARAVQECGMEFMETLFSRCTYTYRPHDGIEFIVELSKRFLASQKELGLHYLPQFARIKVALSVTLTQVDFEHEVLSILKLFIFLFEWKTRTEHYGNGEASQFNEELLYCFPVISLVSSPSKSVKASATFLLSAIEKLIPNSLNASVEPVTYRNESLHMKYLTSFPFRLLHLLWNQEQTQFKCSTYLGLNCNADSKIKDICSEPNFWICELRAYFLTADRQSIDNRLAGTCLLLCSILSTLVLHPLLGSSAVDSFAALALVSPKLGMPLLQALLFHTKMLCCYKSNSPEMLLRLYEMLPAFATQSAMVPLILQTLLPMLQKSAKPVLYATGIRLLCKTWIATDRAFVPLQEALRPEALLNFISERQICISIASTVRDVCMHNPDRGVDLILTVSACIESQDSTVQALGFESLAYLCGADVVDFYTAWDVIEEHMMDYSSDPILANGVCSFLRWGAMDASAYPEISKTVIHILWNVATSEMSCSASLWVKARASAFESLSQYEVDHVKNVFPDFREIYLRCLIAETNAKILTAMEEFASMVIDFEHINRRRGLKQKKIVVHKVDKLMNLFPQAIFPPGYYKSASDLPGAALLSLLITPKDMHGTSKDLAKLNSAYEKALMDISDALQVSRNILVALLALQSWQAFFRRWIRAVVTHEDAKGSSITDKNTKAANYIFQVLREAATEVIPRVAVNIALAIGALCVVLPPSTHSVISAASSFLLEWLDDNEHEHRQWSAAISLGLIYNCLHATDKYHKLKIITELLKIVCRNKSYLVKGACSIGLGFACQDILMRVDINDTNHEEGMMLVKIIRTLCSVLSQLCPSASNSLKNLCKNFRMHIPVTLNENFLDFPLEDYENLEEDVWGIAGLVMGLGYSSIALYRLGAYSSVVEMKDMLISWIPRVDSSVRTTIFSREMTEVPLSVGACLVLPNVMGFCHRNELIDNYLDSIMDHYSSLISGLLCSKKSGALYQNLLMASCTGAGSFLSHMPADGKHSHNFDYARNLLGNLREAYTHSFPSYVRMGGMLGMVNAFGAGACDLIHICRKTNKQESSSIAGTLLSSPECEELCTSMVQELFLFAKESKDQQIKQNSAWAVSFLREKYWSNEFHDSDTKSGSSDSSVTSQNFAEDSLVLKLCLWLRETDSNKDEMIQANTVSTILRCLSKAPRLPAFDWGIIVRRWMRHGAKLSIDVRKECICFSLAHASNITSLVLFLDELTDLSRFKTLESNLQSMLLCRISDLLKLFSGSRLEKFSEDFVVYFSSSNPPILLRVSIWKGLHDCFVKNIMGSSFMSYIGKCMECLFHILPVPNCEASSQEELYEVIRCLSKAPQVWLMNLLQVQIISWKNNKDDAAKRISTMARLVKIGCISSTELDKIKAYILNTVFDDILWNVLLDVAAAVATTNVNTKMQWLLDAIEISSIAEYPSTALRFICILSGICCKYMPLLIVDPETVLIDLSITLPSLLSEPIWNSIAEPASNKLWASTERICTWATCVTIDKNNMTISDEEVPYSGLLAQSLHKTCVALKEYLPMQKQFKLANLNLP